MQEFPSSLINFLLRARFGVRIHASSGFGEMLVDEVARCLRRRLAVDLSMDGRVEKEILCSTFLFNRLLLARQAGANICVTSATPPAVGLIFQADFGDILVAYGSEQHLEVRIIEANNPDFETYNGFLDHVGAVASEFIPDPTDIQLNAWVESGDAGKFVIGWTAKNADLVVCDGLGDMRLSGKTTLSVRSDTILVIRASSQEQMRFKALPLKLNAELKVNFDIQFFNPISSSFYSLRDAGTQDIYGVVAGTKVRLTWHAGKAEEVEILPFGLHAPAGEHIFYPADAGEIVIRAKIRKGVMQLRNGDVVEHRIRIREFPVPVFINRFISPDLSTLGNARIVVNDLRMKSRTFLEDRGFLQSNHDLSHRWRKKLLADFERLTMRMRKLSFAEFYSSHSVPELNRMAIDRLKQLYPKVWSKNIL
jgi:hypothetical protein